jgi:hypothetical protein
MRTLVTHEKDMLIRWMLTYMTGEQRQQMMGDLPVVYKILHPGVPDDAITSKVIQRFRQVEGQSDILPAQVNL